MAKLNAAARKALPSSSFAGPGRSYPVPDKSHAANAKARVANKSPALKAKVDAKANKVLSASKGATKVSSSMDSRAMASKRAANAPVKGPIDKNTLASMAGSLNFK
jgi:hypothetical protein